MCFLVELIMRRMSEPLSVKVSTNLQAQVLLPGPAHQKLPISPQFMVLTATPAHYFIRI